MNALASIIARSRAEREDWRYTDVEKILGASSPTLPPAANEFQSDLPSRIVDPARRQRIVFVDGVWRPDLTQFGALSPALVQGDAAQGYRLSFAPQTCLVTAPIELVLVAEQGGESAFKLAVDVGANSSLTVVEHYVGRNVEAATQMVETEFHLGKQSKLVHGKVMHAMGGAAHFARADVRVEEGAYYLHFILAKRTRLLRHEVNVNLAGPLAQCGLHGALLLQGREHADVVTRVHHAAPYGTSRQLFKAIVKDQARGVFQGRIKVAEGAQKTDGRQLCRALLLSDQAEMDAKPELEIYADDVACSHGCAIGDLDADAMFYLRTRGLSEAEARALLLRAFVDEAIDTIQSEEARVYVRSLAERWMHEHA